MCDAAPVVYAPAPAAPFDPFGGGGGGGGGGDFDPFKSEATSPAPPFAPSFTPAPAPPPAPAPAPAVPVRATADVWSEWGRPAVAPAPTPAEAVHNPFPTYADPFQAAAHADPGRSTNPFADMFA